MKDLLKRAYVKYHTYCYGCKKPMKKNKQAWYAEEYKIMICDTCYEKVTNES